jgi:hypothetical protein
VTARLQLLSGYEAAVLNVLRRQPWCWVGEREITREAQSYQRHTKPRTVRYHLRRFVELGLIERTAELHPLMPGVFWRWNADAPAELTDWLESAAEAAILHLEPLGTPPTHCEHGHDLARHGQIYPDGVRMCLWCTAGVVEPADQSE